MNKCVVHPFWPNAGDSDAVPQVGDELIIGKTFGVVTKVEDKGHGQYAVSYSDGPKPYRVFVKKSVSTE